MEAKRNEAGSARAVLLEVVQRRRTSRNSPMRCPTAALHSASRSRTVLASTSSASSSASPAPQRSFSIQRPMAPTALARLWRAAVSALRRTASGAGCEGEGGAAATRDERRFGSSAGRTSRFGIACFPAGGEQADSVEACQFGGAGRRRARARARRARSGLTVRERADDDDGLEPPGLVHLALLPSGPTERDEPGG